MNRNLNIFWRQRYFTGAETHRRKPLFYMLYFVARGIPKPTLTFVNALNDRKFGVVYV